MPPSTRLSQKHARPHSDVSSVARNAPSARSMAPGVGQPATYLPRLSEYKELPWPAAIVDPTLHLTVDDTYEVGRLIVEVIHDGSRDTHKSRKAWSLRRIQQYILSAASFATLARCVQTYETCRRLSLTPPFGDLRAGHLLNVAHARPAKQRMLLRKAGKQGLSVEQLRQSAGRTGRGTRGQPPLLKALTALRQHRLLDDLEQLGNLPRGEGLKLRREVGELREQLRLVEKQLRRLGFA